MALPKITQPIYKLQIPSTKKEINMRPMLVKEEKILLMAKESDEAKDRLQAIKQVVNNCIQDDIDIDTLALFDIEWLFLRLRSMSVNNEVTIEVTDEDDEKKREFTINLDKIEVDFSDLPSNEITVNEDTTIMLRWPTSKLYNSLAEYDTEEEIMDALMVDSLEKMYQGEEIYDLTKETPENLRTFIDENLPAKAYADIREYLSGMPSLNYEIKYTNDKKEEKTITLSGLNDFFTF